MEYELIRAVEALPGLVWTSPPDGHLDFLSPSWHQYTGLSTGEALDPAWRAAIHPDDRLGVVETWRNTLESGVPHQLEARIRRNDGEYRWHLCCAFPLTDTNGRIVKWCGMGLDIEDRKRAHEALLSGEKRLLEMVADGSPLKGVLDALCHLVAETDDGCYCGILFYNPAGTQWQLGAGPDLPSGYNEAMHGRPAHRESGPCGLAAFLKERVIVSDLVADTRWDKFGFRTLALSHGLQSCWSSPILAQDKEALGALAIYRREPGGPTAFQYELIAKLTHIASIAVERSRSEGALKRSEAFLAEAQRLSMTGSFSWRASTDEVTWSEQAHRIFGLTPGVLATIETIAARVHPEDRKSLQELIVRLRSGGGGLEQGYEHRLLMPDGLVKHLHLVARGSRDADGQLEYIGAVQDVTQRRLAEEALGKARSELAHVARVTSLGVLTASIAHELNQPLSGIVTNASTGLRMLGASPPNLEGARETMRRTLRDGNRASEVIMRLRALFSKKEPATESVDLNEAVREVIALSRCELLQSRVVLRQQLANDLPPVTGDRVQLQQVILNLLLNALDAMSEVDERPRELVMRTESDDGESVRVTVQDAGVGFDREGTERLFEAFYTTKTNGMGIGLSVSRSIVETHRGRLWAIPNDGPGSAFSFSIPRSSEGVRERTGAHAL
jgi:PAS domain S-box-containing protein